MKLNVLGTEYDIQTLKSEEDDRFKEYDAYCDSNGKTIVVCNLQTQKGWENEPESYIEAAQKRNLRHEIVHAFLNESGLMHNANISPASWAINEEMVDWIAIQGPKIYKAWQEADAL